MGHGRAVDWWTFGALIYEMLTGLPPFYSQSREELFERIKFGTLRFPAHLSESAVSLLQGLFIKNADKRLGGGAEDAAEIKRHPWFKTVNWDDFLAKRIRPPYVPKLSSDLDLSNFDTEFTELPVDSVQDQFIPFSDPEKLEFEGFSFVREEGNSLLSNSNSLPRGTGQ
eukprot:TRINITY_DN5922_c0_g1_i8.p2 TRINITY_DN5922_c0_g1~~TRINITY_DN5922_c0_g1_i8.p2  ORF type:complete len:169 (+),score=24.94 TRINITY_DN5922_c0_g1_i8:754-1260(+)